jgi:hypothetical protein
MCGVSYGKNRRGLGMKPFAFLRGSALCQLLTKGTYGLARDLWHRGRPLSAEVVGASGGGIRLSSIPTACGMSLDALEAHLVGNPCADITAS